MRATLPIPRIYSRTNTAYFWTREDAETVRDAISAEFPQARIVYYGAGWTVQIRKSGDYIGRNNRPSLEVQ